MSQEQDIQKEKMQEEDKAPAINFFQRLTTLIDGVNVTIKASKKEGKIKVDFFPSEVSAPISISGTAEEMDDGFFGLIVEPISVARDLQVTVANEKANRPAPVPQAAAKADTAVNKEPASKSSKSKPSAKKIVKQKPEAPDMFAGL